MSLGAPDAVVDELVDDAYDNALAESFVDAFKTEALGDRPPAEYERRYFDTPTAA